MGQIEYCLENVCTSNESVFSVQNLRITGGSLPKGAFMGKYQFKNIFKITIKFYIQIELYFLMGRFCTTEIRRMDKSFGWLY